MLLELLGVIIKKIKYDQSLQHAVWTACDTRINHHSVYVVLYHGFQSAGSQRRMPYRLRDQRRNPQRSVYHLVVLCIFPFHLRDRNVSA